MKAFLSHSSLDKEFVRSVAKELGRQFCVFDEQSFSSGDEFKKAIEARLNESTIFVLFASKTALESHWVNFEISESWVRLFNTVLSKSLVYLIDSSVGVKDLPEWMQRALVRRENSSKAIARDIRHHLDQLLRERRNPYFLGRSREIQEVEEAMTPLDESVPPHAICISGLPGIGRRSLVRHTVPSILNLDKYIELRIDEGATLNDVCILVADYIEPYSTREGFEKIVQKIRTISDEEALVRIVEGLRAIVKSNELPVFVDEGGMLNDEGYFRLPISSIIDALSTTDSAYFFLITYRKPRQSSINPLPVIHLNPLKQDDTKRLVALLAKYAEVSVTTSDLAEISAYVAGYPPAAYYAVQQAKHYGIELLLRDKSALVQFRTSVFLKHLSSYTLNEYDKHLLRLLATYSPLPLLVISDVLDFDHVILNDTIVRVIDLALVITTPEGFYRIADPIADATLKAFGQLDEQISKDLAWRLYEFLQHTKSHRQLALSRVLFRAARLSKDEILSKKATHLTSDLVRVIAALYREKRYTEVEETAYLTLEENPDDVNTRSYLIRSLIQSGKWQQAEEEISIFQTYARQREVYFMIGFLERKRGNLDGAIKAFQRSKRYGSRKNAISKELALCYLLTGDLGQAWEQIQLALVRENDNPYVIDLWLEIATRKKDQVAIRKALATLQVVGTRHVYLSRLARTELALGNLIQARTAAKQAVELSKWRSYDLLAQLCYCEIALGNLNEAENLTIEFEKLFGGTQKDISVGLRCLLEIANGKYKEALAEAERIEKNSYIYKKIRYDALTGEIRSSVLVDGVRTAYQIELSALEAELGGTSTELFFAMDYDTPF